MELFNKQLEYFVEVGSIIIDESIGVPDLKKILSFMNLTITLLPLDFILTISTHLETLFTMTSIYWFANKLGNRPLKSIPINLGVIH